MHLQVKRLGLAVAAVSLLTALQASPAWATVAIGTILQSGNTTVLEGSSTTLLFKVTNNDTISYVEAGDGFIGPTFLLGDPSDGPPSDGGVNLSPAGLSGGQVACNNLTLAPGASCFYSLTLDTTADPGGMDSDFGNFTVGASTDWRPAGLPDVGSDGLIVLTIQDVPVVTVPEPASLALFAPALLGLGFFARRNRKRG